MKNNIISGIIGAALVAFFGAIAIGIFKPIDQAPIYLLNPEKSLEYSRCEQLDSIQCVHMEVIKDLESKNLLLTPDEYTSHVSSYYSTLIGFLLGLFAIFTIGGIYSIINTSKKEIEDSKKDLEEYKESLARLNKSEILSSLENLMKDSIAFKDICVNSIYGRVEDELRSKGFDEKLEDRLTKVEKDIEQLNETFSELEEEISSNAEIASE